MLGGLQRTENLENELSWSLYKHHKVADATRTRADGVTSTRPEVTCPKCTKTFPASSSKKSTCCKHLVPYFDVNFCPCNCKPTHSFIGVLCRVVLRIKDIDSSTRLKHYQCLSCSVRWRVRTIPSEGDHVDHVYAEGERLHENPSPSFSA